MRIPKILTIFFQITVCVAVCSANLFASTDETMQALSELAKNVTVKKLSNGVTVLLHKRGVAPVFAGAVVVNVGGVDELPGHTGISHLLEHMAFKGTSSLGTNDYSREKKLLNQLEEIALETNSANNFTDEQKAKWQNTLKELEKVWDSTAFDREYQQRGATGMNATTAKEQTNYFVSLPINQLEYWAWIESERIVNPVMRQFYSERDVVMEERRMRFEDIPINKLYENLLSVAYQKHTYRNPVIGFPEDIQHLTASQTEAFQKRFYVPQNIAVGLVGDIDIENALLVLERYFGRIATGKDPKRPNFVEPEQVGERIFSMKMDAQVDMLLSYHKPAYPDVDDVALTVLQEILAGSRIARLPRILIEEKKVATNIDVFEAPGSKYPNLIVFQVTPRSGFSNQHNLQEFEKVIEDFKLTGPTSAEVDIAKRAIAMSFLTGLNDNMSMAKDLAGMHLTYGDWKMLIKWYEQMLSVTAADIKKVANKYLVKNHRVQARIER